MPPSDALAFGISKHKVSAEVAEITRGKAVFLHVHIYAPASSHSKTCGIAVLCDREFRFVAGCRLPQVIIFSHSHDCISQSFNRARLCVVSFVSSLHVLERYVCLRSASLVAFQGGQAAVQPGKLGDLMLHETAVAWIHACLEQQK